MSNRAVIVLFLIFFSVASLHVIHAQEKNVRVIKVQAAITPTISEYIIKSLRKASSAGDEAIVIELDTPGGLDTSMRDIVKELLTPPLPVVVYVHPSGGRAASAGTLITLAANIAAMTPGTNIGAAHPVNIGGTEISKEMNEKITNDAVAYIKGLAEKRGRNAGWAEKAVKDSASIPAEEALRLKVIDVVAKDIDDLLEQIDGRKVAISGGERVLSTRGARVIQEEMGFGEKVLNAISDPNVAYILMMLGIYGLFFELANPGAIFPGVLGAICLILAFYSFQTIPVNYAGALFILLAIVLFFAEAMVTSYGVLAIGGIVSMFLGSIMLFESPLPYLRASLQVIIATVLVTAALFIAAISLAVRAQFRKAETGSEGMIGQVGTAKSRIAPEGKVFVAGEYWDAESDETIEEGEKIRVVSIEGLKLRVARERHP